MLGWRSARAAASLVAVAGSLALALPTAAGGTTPVDQASTSARGVTTTAINVVFPVVNLEALASVYGFAGDVEYTEQAKAIDLFVGQINAAGGINGRKINPIISYFNPASESDMRALCKDWTQGSPAAFAVLDGVGDWTGDNELCITQEGHTPFIGQWTTVSDWTQEGSPYLWWTGPDDASILQAVVQWGRQCRAARGTPQGGGHCGRPGQRSAGPRRLPAARSQAHRGGAGGRDDSGPAGRDGRHGQ